MQQQTQDPRDELWGMRSMSPEEMDKVGRRPLEASKASYLRDKVDQVVKTGTPIQLCPDASGKVMGMAPVTLNTYLWRLIGPGVISTRIYDGGLVIAPKVGPSAVKQRKKSRAEIIAEAAALPDNLGRGLFLLPKAVGLNLNLVKFFMDRFKPEGYIAVAIGKGAAPHTANGVQYCKFAYLPEANPRLVLAHDPILRDPNGEAL